MHSFNARIWVMLRGDIAFELEGTPDTGTDEDLPDQLMTVISDKWSDPQEVERGTDKYILNNAYSSHISSQHLNRSIQDCLVCQLKVRTGYTW